MRLLSKLLSDGYVPSSWEKGNEEAAQAPPKTLLSPPVTPAAMQVHERVKTETYSFSSGPPPLVSE